MYYRAKNDPDIDKAIQDFIGNVKIEQELAEKRAASAKISIDEEELEHILGEEFKDSKKNN